MDVELIMQPNPYESPTVGTIPQESAFLPNISVAGTIAVAFTIVGAVTAVIGTMNLLAVLLVYGR